MSASGTGTKRRTQASSQLTMSVEECVAIVDDISKKKRVSRKVSTAPSGSASTSCGVSSSDSGGNFSPTGDGESVAVQVWKEMFEGDDFRAVIEQFDFVKLKVGEFLEPAEKDRMI